MEAGLAWSNLLLAGVAASHVPSTIPRFLLFTHVHQQILHCRLRVAVSFGLRLILYVIVKIPRSCDTFYKYCVYADEYA